MADPEPGRCRRTDGKKWRCYKNVVEGQKYCERHMHRGRRQRSRKLVEDLGNACIIADTNTLLSASSEFQLDPPASGTGKRTTSMVNVCSISRKKVNVDSHHSSGFPTTASIKADANCRNPSVDLKNGSATGIQSEAMRCKRTDGKHWQCSHNVLNGEKYCGKHMHRGAKKVTQFSNPLVVAAADPSGDSDNPFYIAKRANSCINLNVDPCSSFVTSFMTVNDVNQPTRSSSSSDATTISID